MFSRPLSDHAFRNCVAGVLLAGAIVGLIAIRGIDGVLLAIVFVSILRGMAQRSRYDARSTAKIPPPEPSMVWWRHPVWQYTSLLAFAVGIAFLVWCFYTNPPSN